MAKNTKQELARAIQILSRGRDIKDIQVKDLCHFCKINRSTFYYHFYDKYELVAWIFYQTFLQASKQAKTINDADMIQCMLEKILEKKDFFVKALTDHSQNNLREYILNFYIQSEKEVLMLYYDGKPLSEELEYAIYQYSYGSMGITIDWLLGKNKYTAKKLAYYQYFFMPEDLKRAYARQ